MVIVAVAGGTGSLGQTIVEALEADSKHDFIILTRTATMQLASRTVAIDYGSVDSIAKTLKQHQVHTVVSALLIRSPEQCDAQLNLIQGAAKSSCVKRFTPSEFGPPRREGHGVAATMFDYKMAAEAELQKTHLEYTLFSHGFFMDYYGMPGIKSYMKPWVFAIDIAHRVAGIPGSGDTPAVYTYSGDVAKFVVATLSLPEKSWQKYSIMIGDRKTLNEILHIAESVCGEKFTVHYDSLEKMHGGEITELPSHRPTYEIVPKEKLQSGFANFGIGIEQGNFDFHAPKGIKLLNDLFPNITLLSVEELITKGWT